MNFESAVQLTERRNRADRNAAGRLASYQALLRKHFLFVLTVVVPTLVATIYFGFLASNVYESEARLVVRSPTRGVASPLGALLSGGALAGGGEESNAVVEYIRSRAALDETDRDGLVRRAYGPAHASWVDRFGGLWSGTSREHLYLYFSGKVAAEYDTTTQVIRLSVRAFDPRDAQQINARLLRQAETLVNRLSERARGDAIAIAGSELEEAKRRARDATLALSEYRNSAGVIDPEKEAAVRLQMISKLQDELIAARTQLQQVEQYTPAAPQIPFLRTRVAALAREVAQQTAGVAGARRSLSAFAARYQELQLNSQLADKQLAAVLASLEDARAEARRKKAYVERIAEPSLSDYALEPHRIRNILATFILGLLAWGVLSTLVIGIREHQDQ